jgi:glycosyltransferase involved in cell wall biosynthesis
MSVAPPLKVAVDASWFGPAARGMARHAANLLRSDRISPILLNDAAGVGRRRLWPARVPQPVFEQLCFHRGARRRGADACLSPYNTAPLWPVGGLRQVTVIHDLIYLRGSPGGPGVPRGTAVQAIGRQYRRLVVPRVARKASVVVTVSGMVRDQLIQELGVDPSRIFVVPNTTDPELFEPYTADLGERVRMLVVTGVAPHKNLSRLMTCVARLIDEGAPLAIDVLGVGAAAGAALLRTLSLDARGGAFAFHKDVPRAAVHRLYRAASCFVMPSLAEGFGIPLLEALAAGLPAAASDIPAFREIAGAECAYFDPCSLESMHAAIGRVVEGCLSACGTSVARSARASAMRFSPAGIASAVDRLWAGVMVQA